jgi:glycosyltransferase involved in cell wall biosynthesis
MGDKVGVFTIASKNYLPQVRLLFSSLREHHPQFARCLILCDEAEGVGDLAGKIFEVLPADQLPIKKFRHMAFKYKVVELNTAVKPFAAQALFAKWDVDALVYLDPDIFVYRPLEELLQALEDHSIVLIPHLTDFLVEDGRMPDERVFLQCGAYNLGFLALRRGKDAARLLSWWAGHCADDCRESIEDGLFVDQKWVDLVPGFFDLVYILRHPGYDTAYWNLPHRPLARDASGAFLAAGRPLAFFHFSGFNPLAPQVVSKYSDRYRLGQLGEAATALFRAYRERLLAAGYQEAKAWPYAYGRFRGGPKIPDFCRSYFREKLAHRIDPAADPFDPNSRRPSVFDLLQSPVDGQPLTACALALHRATRSLQKRFPAVPGNDAPAYAKWFVSYAGSMYGLDDVFLQPMRELVGKLGRGRSQGVSRRLFNKLVLGTYRVLERLPVKHLFPVSFRRSFGKRMLDKGYGLSDPASRPPAALKVRGKGGVNLYGLLDRPLGTGEAARASARALEAAGVPFAPVPVTEANLSGSLPFTAGQRDGPSYGVNLCHVNADNSASFFRNLGSAGGLHYNIGFWMWELELFPGQFDTAFPFLDEVWVPSTFTQRSVSQRSPVPVVCVPLSIEVRLPDGDPRAAFGIPADRPAFLCMFDTASYFERKNPLAAIRAFKAACAGRIDPLLIVKVGNPETDSAAVRGLKEELQGLEAILIDRWLGREETWALVAACDSLISLHRSEGFGLVIAEAMALGKPVIATAYSGNMDFMTVGNSFPVRYTRTRLERDVGPYPRGAEWAEPDIDHAADLIRRIVEDPAGAAAVGRQAARDVAEQLSPAAVGRCIRARLKALGFTLPPAPEEPPAPGNSAGSGRSGTETSVGGDHEHPRNRKPEGGCPKEA